MPIHELRNPTDARQYLLQSLWLQRILPPRAGTVPTILEWALDLSGGGEPLPPLGFVADVGHAVLQGDISQREPLEIPGWPEGLARTYEDYVLGKLFADSSFERAGDALRHYHGRDQARGLAFLLTQFRHRAGFGGVLLSPAIVKALRDRSAHDALAEGWDSFSADGPMPLLISLYEELTQQVRQTAGILGPEDVFELEHRTALAEFSQRLALRQVLQASAALQAELPDRGLRPKVRRHEVPTRLLDEDMYPVGGFSSISNRGSIESLLHSQLALMEDARPDLFDVRYVRDELLYYSRDENQFLRRRRTFVFALQADLAQSRFKDAELPWQRIVLLLGLVLAATGKLIEWLSEEAVTFEFLLIGDERALASEKALLETVLREQIANDTAIVANLAAEKLGPHCAGLARRSQCLLLSAGVFHQPVEAEGVRAATLAVGEAHPDLVFEDDNAPTSSAEDPLSGWTLVLRNLLENWI